VLNVAGPRASKWAEGYGFALSVVRGIIEHAQRHRTSGGGI
jgi:hypothetical protein